MATMSDKDAYNLIRSIRRNWGVQDHDFDRSIRALGQALLRCESEETAVFVRATIDEAATRQTYQLLRDAAAKAQKRKG